MLTLCLKFVSLTSRDKFIDLFNYVTHGVQVNSKVNGQIMIKIGIKLMQHKKSKLVMTQIKRMVYSLFPLTTFGMNLDLLQLRKFMTMLHTSINHSKIEIKRDVTLKSKS